MSDLQFPDLDVEERDRLLAEPTGPVRVLIDTDAANEIDDQFALAWAFLAPERLTIEAVVAEPYSFAHLQAALAELGRALEAGDRAELDSLSDDASRWARRLEELDRRPEDIDFVQPDEGMEQSYQEILRVLDRLGVCADGRVYRGAPRYLERFDDPVDSPGVQRIIELAMSSEDEPLYILALGCPTNIASALLLEPEIVRRIVVVWTSAYPTRVSRSNRPSLNLVQDPVASRLLYDSGVPLVYLPGYYIGAQLRLSMPEIEAYARGYGAIGDYLHELYRHNPMVGQPGGKDFFATSRVIWDIINVAWVLEPSWVPTELVPTPQLDHDLRWRPRSGPVYPLREAYAVDRDGIFRDFFGRLQAHARTDEPHRDAATAVTD